MAGIHATAVIEPGAELDEGVEVGPFAVIGPQVRIGAGTVVGPHVVISGRTRIGRDNRIFPFAAIGGIPQDKKYAGEDAELHIGDRNTIRECCTLNIGTAPGGGVTRIGHDNWIMAYVHVAHDCVLGDHTVLANAVQIAGHALIGDWAVLGGQSGVHQFCRVGAHAMIGAGSTIVQDVPPYVTCGGLPVAAHGINAEGLRRRGFTPDQLAALKRAYRLVYRDGLTVPQACEALDALAAEQPAAAAQLALLAGFLRVEGRGIVR